MADIYDAKKRSEVMSKISSKGNKTTEIRLLEVFHSLNITGWKRGYKVIGHPDFVFLNRRIAVFVDGCFWHGHNCRNTSPKQNADFWASKIEKSKKHDIDITDRFVKRGWTVLRIWECELKKSRQADLYKKLEEAGLKQQD